MATAHREVYQPSFEDTPTYDLQDDEVEDARARLPLLIVIALLVLAAFGGVVWLAYNQGVESGRLGVPAIITAPEGPVRTAPEQQAADAPMTGLSVYEQPVAPEQEAAQSTLAPAAEPAPLRAAQPATPIVTPPPAPAIAAAPPPAPAVAAVPPPAPAPLRPAPAPAAPPPAPAVAAAPPPPPPPAAVPAAAPAPNNAMAGAAAVLQLGSYPDEASAMAAFATFRTRYPDIVGRLSSDVQVANIPNRGTFYRLRVGPYSDRASAIAACETLRTQGGNCLVLNP
jgi:hypothetical protein